MSSSVPPSLRPSRPRTQSHLGVQYLYFLFAEYIKNQEFHLFAVILELSFFAEEVQTYYFLLNLSQCNIIGKYVMA